MFQFGNFSYKEVLTITFTLFAVIDILGSIPILVSLREKMGGKIKANLATIASGSLTSEF